MIVWTDYPPGDHRASCPSCGRKPSDKSMGITIEADGAGVAHCFRCDFVETWREQRTTRRPGKVPASPVAPRKHETLSEYGRDLWSACTGLAGTIGEAYLLHRRCATPPADGDQRYHPSLKHPSGYVGPALVALITHAVTREPLSLHRTWITPTGKAAVDPARLLLKGHTKAGGVIRLWPDEAVTTGLAIGEGIETCLSLAHAFTPVWACIDAGNLGAFPVLPGIECLTIAADHDPAGTEAARRCAAAWAGAGGQVRIVMAPSAGQDLNDLAAEGAA